MRVPVLGALLLGITLGAPTSKRLSDEELASEAGHKRAKIKQNEPLTEQGVHATLGHLGERDLKKFESLLAETWEVDEIPGKLWGFQAGFKCSPLISIAFASQGISPAWLKIFEQLHEQTVKEYPRLAACMLTPGFLPPPSSDAIKKELAPKIQGLAELVLPRLSQTVEDRDFRNDLKNEILLAVSNWVPFVGPYLKCKSHAECLEVLKDFDQARAFEGIFINTRWILMHPNTLELLDVLQYLDLGVCQSKEFLFTVLMEAIRQDSFEVVDYLQDQYSLIEYVRDSDKIMDIVLESGTLSMLKHLERLGYRGLRLMGPEHPKIVIHDRADIWDYAWKKGYVHNVSNDYLSWVMSHGSRKLITYFKTVHNRDLIPDETTLKRAISACRVAGIKFILESTDLTLSTDPKDYEDANARGLVCLETVKYLYDMVPGNIHEKMRIVSGDYAAVTRGNTAILYWIKNMFDNQEMPFPELTLDRVRATFLRDGYVGFSWYQSVVKKPIPFLEVLTKSFRENQALYGKRCLLLNQEGQTIYWEDLRLALQRRELDAYRFVQRYFPERLDEIGRNITDQTVCGLINSNNTAFLEWVLEAFPNKFQELECRPPLGQLDPEHLPSYIVAHEKTGWLPAVEKLNEQYLYHVDSLKGQLALTDFIIWALKVFKKSWEIPFAVLKFLAKRTMIIRHLIAIAYPDFQREYQVILKDYLNTDDGIFMVSMLPSFRPSFFESLTNQQYADYIQIKTKIMSQVIDSIAAWLLAERDESNEP